MISTHRRTSISAAAFTAAAGLLASTAVAQTGPELLIKPWPSGETVDLSADVRLYKARNSGNEPFGFGLNEFESAGRFRVWPTQRADPRLGYRALHMDLDTNDPALPSRLSDVSVAGGVGVLSYDGWLGGIVIGAGHASADPFGDGNGWYGMASFAVGKTLGNGDELGIVLDYNGNRPIFPDVPLPGFAYRKRVADELLLAFGFPFSSLEWTPAERVKVELIWSIPENFEVSVEYGVTDHFSFFGQLRARNEAFAFDDLPDGDDRLLFEQRYAEAGVRWKPADEVSLIVSGGYAFDQEFRSGFDTRDSDEVAEVSDGPFLRLAAEARW